MSTNNKNNSLSVLSKHLNHTVELPSFVETITQNQVKWLREGDSAVCNCPMTWHTDKNASFHMNRLDGLWTFHCFGCNSKGTTVKFFMDYSGEEDWKKAVTTICDRLNVKYSDDMLSESYEYSINRVDKKKEIEMANIVTSNVCRKLLFRNRERHFEWVMDAYKRLNLAIEDENGNEIEKIGQEAFKRMVK